MAATAARTQDVRVDGQMAPLDVSSGVLADPVASAKEAGLRYVSDEGPGIRRKARGTRFQYVGTDGGPIRDDQVLARIAALAIPPAWTDVWICPSPRGHLQATGRDAKGRKQYRYHAKWRVAREESKYGRMLAFGRALPLIRARTDADLRRPGLPREKVLAAVVQLLEKTLIRVGNEEYARDNKSFGLTTLRNRHVEVDGSKLRFKFRGKSGKQHAIGLNDRRLARVVARLQDLPGQALFQYVDDDGDEQRVDSSDVNEYLHAIAGEEFTAKDFRTWAGTVLCTLALQTIDRAESETEAKRNVAQVVRSVSDRLGNTPAVCRKSYIHPEVIDAYLDGSMLDQLSEQVAEVAREAPDDLTADERAVMRLLRRRLAEAS